MPSIFPWKLKYSTCLTVHFYIAYVSSRVLDPVNARHMQKVNSRKDRTFSCAFISLHFHSPLFLLITTTLFTLARLNGGLLFYITNRGLFFLEYPRVYMHIKVFHILSYLKRRVHFLFFQIPSFDRFLPMLLPFPDYLWVI